MADADKSIYGRKVFFLTPTTSFESLYLERLRNMEYEVYVINDYRKAKPLLRKNPDSICFCVVGSQLTLKGWHNFIKSFADESVFRPLDLGIILPVLAEDKLSNFCAGLQYDAGLFTLDGKAEELFRAIVKSLDSLGAKGLRKYVRANCLNENQADLIFMKDNRMFKLKIIDISSVGMAAKLSVKQANIISVNQIINKVTLNLRNINIVVDIQVTTIKAAGDFLLVIIMFADTVQPDAINKIRTYISDNLKETLRSSIKTSDLDMLDYEKLE